MVPAQSCKERRFLDKAPPCPAPEAVWHAMAVVRLTLALENLPKISMVETQPRRNVNDSGADKVPSFSHIQQ
jgi:hypothetical protein